MDKVVPVPDLKLANYRLDRLLGSGGMGSVYLAHDLTLDRDVAIKFIAADRIDDPDARRRLIHEARAAAALDHPNICTVFDVIVESDGRACIVMQYVEGETLAEILRRGPLDIRRALTIAADVAAALAAAHRHGIIHRDLKPQNVIVTPSRRAKLLDFGIARMAEKTASATGSETTDAGLTGPGKIAGTPAYMSPEQVQLQALDGRSDLFALGAVLFECLTGRRAFDGATPIETYGKILHEHPPAVSAIRSDASEREDELCRRLLAKHPDDRFQSAEELLGALRMMVPDTARPERVPTGAHGTAPGALAPATAGINFSRIQRAIAVLVCVAIIGAVGVWRWQSRHPLPVANAAAERWYVRGTESIRDGAYYSARLALQEAIASFPQYAQAYARMAEAHSELDEEESAQRALLQVDALVGDPSRLPKDDHLRLDAIRSVILRDVGAAVRACTELATRQPADAGVWVDLGRAQEMAALTVDARASYERAIGIDSQYAAAHLRRASILAQVGARDDALQAFAEAERLYHAASNVEGEAESLLRRGAFLNATGQLREARTALDRATVLAVGVKSRFQEIRAQLHLSSVTASEGRFSDAEKVATDAVDAALREGLETVAADGLVDVANTLVQAQRWEDADAQLARAIQLAEKRRAQRIVVRATLQRAALRLSRHRQGEALTLAESTLGYARSHRYRRYELLGLSIISRAHEELEHYPQAREMAQEVLRAAEELKDESQVALALENLAGQSTAMGALPDAIGFRERGEQIHRRQQDLSTLAFDLANRAELLIRLGRHSEADGVLREVEAGIAKGLEPFKGRARRVQLLRALDATYLTRYDEAATRASEVIGPNPTRLDSTGRLAMALLRHADARLGRRRLPWQAESATPTTAQAPGLGRELRYWELSTQLAAGDPKGALEGVTQDLSASGVSVSYEYEWRMAALGAAAARRIRDDAQQRALVVRAERALQTLHDAWKDAATAYDKRPDLVELSREAGLNPRS